MFLQYLDFIFKPFRTVRNRYMQVRNIRGSIRNEAGRVRSYKQLAKSRVKEAKQLAGQARGSLKEKGALGAMRGAAKGLVVPSRPASGRPPAGAPAKAAPGPAPGRPASGHAGANLAAASSSGYPRQAAMVANQHPANGPGMSPPILSKGILWWKKHFCGQCGENLDRSWDHCPYCAEEVAAPAPAMKTQAISMDAAGHGHGHQMLAWLVPLAGPQRGELFTLAPITTVGTDADCTVVLISDSYMSSRHAEIKAEGGLWILKDLRSTNGTYVNNKKRVDQHELVDSDFIRFGQTLVKFKCI